MRIRQADATDLERICSALLVAYEPVLQRMASADAGAFRERLPGAVSRYATDGTWLVAEQEGIVGAVAFFAPGATTHPLFQGNVAHIQLLGVVPSHARRGVGRALVAECLSMAAAAGSAELLLHTSDLMSEAQRLYKSLGFTVRKQLPPAWGAPSYLYASTCGAAMPDPPSEQH